MEVPECGFIFKAIQAFCAPRSVRNSFPEFPGRCSRSSFQVPWSLADVYSCPGIGDLSGFTLQGSFFMTLPQHLPVLLNEVVEWLAPAPGEIFVDGTSGGGGHLRALAAAVGDEGLVLGLDRDPAALSGAESVLRGLPVKLAHCNYADLPELLAQLEIAAVDGILLDLGLSSDQLADPDRGFSFSSQGSLDLRFNVQEGEPAWRLLEWINERQLADLIYKYGEDRNSRRIARQIVSRRRTQPIRSAAELAEVVRASRPKSLPRGRIHPATRTFQALRIAVNEELKWLEVALGRFPACLRPGGRIAVLSFHSLEDRLVKQAFRDDPRLEVRTRKPIIPGPQEIAANPRARSAKLRVARLAPVEAPAAGRRFTPSLD